MKGEHQQAPSVGTILPLHYNNTKTSAYDTYQKEGGFNGEERGASVQRASSVASSSHDVAVVTSAQPQDYSH